MNAPSAVAPRAASQWEGQGRLQVPEHSRRLRVAGYAALNPQRTGSIPQPNAAPPGSNWSRPVTGKCDATGGRAHQANIPTPPSELPTTTTVADALAPAFAAHGGLAQKFTPPFGMG